MAKRKSSSVPPSAEARAQVLTAIRSCTEPLTSRSLAKLLVAPHRISEKELGPILDEYVAADRLHAIPPATAKGKPRYWNRDVIEFGRQAILRAIETQGPLGEAKLKKTAKGLSEAQFQQVLQAALAAGEVWRHPPVGKAKKELFGRKPPSPGPYLQDVGDQLTTIVARLTAAQVPQSDLRRALVQLIEAAGVPLSSAAADGNAAAAATASAVDLIALMRRIEPGADRGTLVGARDLRRAARLDKREFDRAVLDLARQGRLSLHRHDYATSLSVSERDDLVTDGDGTYYVGMALRQSAGGK